MVTVEKKEATKTGVASLGWHLGYGFVQRKMKIKYETWQVIVDGVKLCECSSENKATWIAACIMHWRDE